MTGSNEVLHRLAVGDETVEFSDRGHGEPILFVHAGAFADWYLPTAAAGELAGFRVIRLRRAGYVAEYRPTRHLAIADHARHCGQLLDALGIDSGHVCGHSSGALIVLQLALDRPELVKSMTLLEPAPGGDLATPAMVNVVGSTLGPAMAAWAAGDNATGFDIFMRGVGGEHYRAAIQAALGDDGFRQAVLESAFFSDEARAVMEWQFTPSDAARIHQATLVVEGGTTAQVALPDSVARLAEMVPHAETVVLSGASHLMPLEDPDGVAHLIAEFARKHSAATDLQAQHDTT